MVSKGRRASIEDDVIVARRFWLKMAMEPRGCGIEPVAPCPHHPRGVIGLARAEHDLSGLQKLSTAKVGPAVHRALHPMLDGATERNMYLPYLATTKARTGLGQSKVCWSVVEDAMINRPGTQPQGDCGERRSIEFDSMSG